MKLVMAVISNKDVSKVLDAITKEGFSSSRISTTGQFLADGHTTLFITRWSSCSMCWRSM